MLDLCFFVLRLRRPPISTRTDPICPYTTLVRSVGKGTGVGLSQVYGVVKQSGGHVGIHSEEGEGTTVKIYLPRLMGDGPLDEEESAKPALEHGRSEECLLVVEDDDDVRGYTVELLREIGYRVLEAHDGPSALRLLERQDGPIQDRKHTSELQSLMRISYPVLCLQ